jgi:ABC-2 type transport system permease protein
MRKFGRILAMKWSENLQYRGDILLWTIADALVPLVALAIWYTVAQAGSPEIPPREIFTYYIFITFVRAVTIAWGGYFLATDILRGDLVKYLIRPLSVFWIHAAENVTVKAFRLALPLPLLLIALWRWPDFFSPAIYEPRHVVLFLVSTLLAAILAFTFDMATATIAFWLEDVVQIRDYQLMLYEISSGTLIPLLFLPPLIQSVFSFLPFQYMLATPVEILLGKITLVAAWEQMGIQVLWIIGSAVALTILWRRGLKVYAVPGQ